MATPEPSAYTTDGLIRSLKLRGYFPQGNGFSSSDFLFLASEEQSLYVMAFLKDIRQEYEVVSLAIAVTEATVPVPSRAAGAATRTVMWDPDGSNTNAYPLVRIEPEMRTAYQSSASQPQGYMFEGDNLILVPAVTSGTLRLRYQQRLSRLVLPGQCLQIASISVGDNTVTTEEAVLEAFTVTERYDLNSNTPNFVEVGADLQVSDVDVGTKTFTFSQLLPADLEVGDWLCLTGTCCIPQLPPEVHQLLAIHTAEVIHAGQGSARLPAIQAAAQRARDDATSLLSPRDDGMPRPIIRLGGPGMGWR